MSRTKASIWDGRNRNKLVSSEEPIAPRRSWKLSPEERSDVATCCRYRRPQTVPCHPDRRTRSVRSRRDPLSPKSLFSPRHAERRIRIAMGFAAKHCAFPAKRSAHGTANTTIHLLVIARSAATWQPAVLSLWARKSWQKTCQPPKTLTLPPHSIPNINPGKVSALPPPTCYSENRETKASRSTNSNASVSISLSCHCEEHD
jgi:hypothetical protein